MPSGSPEPSPHKLMGKYERDKEQTIYAANSFSFDYGSTCAINSSNALPFLAFEIEPYSASGYSEDLQPSIHAPGDFFSQIMKESITYLVTENS